MECEAARMLCHPRRGVDRAVGKQKWERRVVRRAFGLEVFEDREVDRTIGISQAPSDRRAGRIDRRERAPPIIIGFQNGKQRI